MTESADTDPRPFVFDCDSHVTEPLELWEQYVPAEYRERVKMSLSQTNYEGIPVRTLNNRLVLATSALTRGGAYRPGLHQDDIGTKSTEGLQYGPEWMTPGGFDPAARLEDMDTDGIDAVMLYPTVCARLASVKDELAAAVLARAYNRWILGYCAADPSRLFGAAVLPLQNAVLARTELDWVAQQGFRCVVIRPNPLPYTPFGASVPITHPAFNPIWRGCEEAGLAVAVHPLPGPEPEVESNRLIERSGAIPSQLGFPYTPALGFPFDNMMAVTALLLSGTFEAFPGVRWVFLESNCSWVPMLLDRCDTRDIMAVGMAPKGERSTLSPSEIFKRQALIGLEGSETALPYLAEWMQDFAIWSSDYPHHDAEPPAEAFEIMTKHGVPASVQTKIMGRNAMRAYGLEHLVTQ